MKKFNWRVRLHKTVLFLLIFSLNQEISIAQPCGSAITWMGNEYTSLSGTVYKGDDILFEIQSNPTSLNQGAQCYIDWGNDGYGSTENSDWFGLPYIKTESNNNFWNKYIRMRFAGTHNRKYLGFAGCTSDYVTSNMGSFTVTDLSNPTAPTTTSASATQINLTWSPWNSKNVMIVRNTSNSFTAPTDGTAYAANDNIGSGIVIYNSNGSSFNNTGLTANTTYYYRLYSVNNDYYSAGINASAATTLPVSFTSLSGNIQGGQARLVWNVAQEIDVDRYEVEESANGRQFHPLTEVDAINRSSYQAVDAQLHLGSNYYRVKAVDIDGKLTYSKVIRLDHGASEAEVRVYPNPTRGELNLGLTNLPADTYMIRVVSAGGQTVYQQSLPHDGGSRSLPLSLEKLAPGIYQVQINGRLIKISKKISVDR